MVETTRLEQRRDNPRAMSTSEYETLKRSMDKFGFKSFVVAEEIEPGRYGVIDGHHRWRAATERGMARIPVVLLDSGTDKSWADLAMLTFNVTGDPQEDKYVELLAELTTLLGAETTALFTALDTNFLESFGKNMAETMDAADAATAAAGGEEAGWQGRPILVEFPRVDDVVALFAEVTALTGETVLGRAVLTALREWVKIKRPAQDTVQEVE
jgi:ParB-like chromosome segregation protein Spo0J